MNDALVSCIKAWESVTHVELTYDYDHDTQQIAIVTTIFEYYLIFIASTSLTMY